MNALRAVVGAVLLLSGALVVVAIAVTPGDQLMAAFLGGLLLGFGFLALVLP